MENKWYLSQYLLSLISSCNIFAVNFVVLTFAVLSINNLFLVLKLNKALLILDICGSN